MHMQKVEIKGHSVQKLVGNHTDRQMNGWTDRRRQITFCANVVDNHVGSKQWFICDLVVFEMCFACLFTKQHAMFK